MKYPKCRTHEFTPSNLTEDIQHLTCDKKATIGKDPITPHLPSEHASHKIHHHVNCNSDICYCNFFETYPQ